MADWGSSDPSWIEVVETSVVLSSILAEFEQYLESSGDIDKINLGFNKLS